MKITKQIDVDVSIRAVLTGDTITLSVTGIAPYGDRTASYTLTDFSQATKAKVKKVLQEVLEESAPRAAEAAENAAAVSRMVAMQMGEKI